MREEVKQKVLEKGNLACIIRGPGRLSEQLRIKVFEFGGAGLKSLALIQDSRGAG